MFLDPLDIPDELLEAQELGRLVIFAGAGVSMGNPSNLPSFKGLALHIAGSHRLAGEIDRYDARLDRFLGELSRQKVEVQKLCRAKIGNPASKPTDLHRNLVDLFPKPEHVRLVTTNFDNHFRSALDERGWKPDCYHAPALPLGHQFSGVVHLHGCTSRAEPLVLTDEDFGRAYLTEGWAREFLQRLFEEFTTLFVGYSHNDLPVEYLARGMSGKSIAPRFALTAGGEAGQWLSLGIKEIVFEKTAGLNPFENLYAGVRRWAEFTKQQPIDIAERVKSIVCAPEILAPDKSQSALLKRCLEREDQCHFFTSEAKGWKWAKWLHEQKLLTSLFDPALRGLTPPQLAVGCWLARILLTETSDEGLLLVECHRGTLGRNLWFALCRELWLNEQVDWNSPLVQKWVLLLLESCPRDSMAELSHLLPKVAKALPQTLGMALLRRLTALHINVTKRLDFEAMMKGGDTIDAKDRADFEITLAGEAHQMEAAWAHLLKHQLPHLAEPLLVLLEDRVRESHEINSTSGRSSATYEPICFRGRIYERNAFRHRNGMELVLDFLLDVVEQQSKEGSGLAMARIASWLASGVPVLVRVGLYALHLSKGISDSHKVRMLHEQALVHPVVCGATHEAWQVLASCYPALTALEKSSLWQAVNDGPHLKRPADVTPEAWESFRQNQIDKLTWIVATTGVECPAARQSLEKLKERRPGFRGFAGMDQVVFGATEVSESPRTPRSVADLLKRSPDSQLDWLMSYEGGPTPFGESREELLHAVGAACAQNPAWGISLLEALGSSQAWTSDLWNTAFWRVKLSSLPQEKLGWLLNSLEAHFANSPSLQGLCFFLFHSVEFSESKRPSADNLALMIRLSLLIWKQLKDADAPVRQGFKEEEWTSRAINHPGGQIAEFWLKCCDQCRRELNGEIPGFPDWLKEPLEDMIQGADLASQLGRVTLGLHLRFLYQVDPAWTEARLFPKLQFSKVGDEAFLLWEPHASYGDLSRDLILVMASIYREAFPQFQDAERRLIIGFFRHVAVFVYSCLIDVNQGNWLRDFLTGLTDEQRSQWAMQVEQGLRGSSEARRALIWQR